MATYQQFRLNKDVQTFTSSRRCVDCGKPVEGVAFFCHTCYYNGIRRTENMWKQYIRGVIRKGF